MANRILDKFRAGERCLGSFTHLLSHPAIEALAHTGLDYVIIDMEHSALGTYEMQELVRTAAGAGLCPAVRVDAVSRPSVLKALDAGAQALIVPNIKSVEEVRRLVEYGKFAPVGERGFCPTRDGAWGHNELSAGGMAAYMARANEETLLFPQCETRGCLDNIEEIAALSGVDGVFIGPLDLSIALGRPGDFENSEHVAAVQRIKRACDAAGKPCLIFTGDEQTAAKYFALGFPNVAMGLDVAALIAAYRSMIEGALQ